HTSGIRCCNVPDLERYFAEEDFANQRNAGNGREREYRIETPDRPRSRTAKSTGLSIGRRTEPQESDGAGPSGASAIDSIGSHLPQRRSDRGDRYKEQPGNENDSSRPTSRRWPGK